MTIPRREAVVAEQADEVVHAALHEVLARRPEVGPVRVDRAAGIIRLAGGAVVTLRDAPRTVEGLVDRLLAADTSRREVASLSLDSWAVCRPRLGLVPARPPTAVSTPLTTRVGLAVAIELETGLIPVGAEHLRRWRQPPDVVVAAALHASTTAPVALRRTARRTAGRMAGGGPVVFSIASGGPFTAGRLLAIETLVGPLGDSTVLATAADRTIVVLGRIANATAPGTVEDTAARLISWRDRIRNDLSSGTPRSAGALLRYRSGGQLAIFDDGAIDQ